MKAYANDFIRTLFENLQTEKNELKSFLIDLISQSTSKHSASEVFVESDPKDWGELIQQRSTPWAKRL